MPEGEAAIPVANKLIDKFDQILATRDWHPRHHGSFAAEHPGKQIGEIIDLHGLKQILWPVHCVQHTRGAEFAPGLNAGKIVRVFRKGTDADIDSYSGLYSDRGTPRAAIAYSRRLITLPSRQEVWSTPGRRQTLTVDAR